MRVSERTQPAIAVTRRHHHHYDRRTVAAVIYYLLKLVVAGFIAYVAASGSLAKVRCRAHGTASTLFPGLSITELHGWQFVYVSSPAAERRAADCPV